MNLHFKPDSVPEIQCVPVELRKEIQIHFVHKQRFSVLQFLAVMLGLFVIVFMPWSISGVIGWWIESRLVVSMTFWVLLIAAIIWLQSILLRWYRQALPDFIDTLHENGRFKKCLKCDYDLRGSQSPTCPECGAAAILAETITAEKG